MLAWRVCGSSTGQVIYAADAASASAQYEYEHGCLPEEITRASNLDGEPREDFSNAELQAAGFSVPCDRCVDCGAFNWVYDMPDGDILAVINGETVCDDCITPRERLSVGGDPDECTYADEFMDLPMAALPRHARPLAEIETT